MTICSFTCAVGVHNPVLERESGTVFVQGLVNQPTFERVFCY